MTQEDQSVVVEINEKDMLPEEVEMLVNQSIEGTNIRNSDGVIVRESNDSPFTSTMTIFDEGMVDIYERKTGRKITILRYLLRELLKDTVDGERRFTTVKPKITPFQGNLKCWLHPDDPDYEVHKANGFPTCRKANLATPYAVEQHVRRRHPSAYEAIMRERLKRKEDEERQWQQSLISAALNTAVNKGAVTTASAASEGNPSPAEKPPLYVSDKDRKKK